ncbi:MAG: NAD(P)-dependent glycerol-3-phosphate dehydrogenase [Erysipelotrichaceae bacterium]|nr:NAD(P)-dependent glycerol-3-phosphate dehydrogenase [Erysipelotrichaceae bacterium]
MKIGVIGAGTWGTALARLLANKGYEVTVYSVIEQELKELSRTRAHKNLPGVEIPESIAFTSDKKELCDEKDILLNVVPSVFVRSTIEGLKDFIKEGQVIVDATKGIETGTLFTMSQVIKDVLKDKNVKVVALSGPTHAEEVSKDLPTTIVAACEDQETAQYVQNIFMTDNMRVYTNEDVLGVELCGALKNIIALACGISTGLGFGDNAKAAIMTRGMAEMIRLGKACGAKQETFSGLAGIGDLIVTATSMHSRNNRCGILIGQGEDPRMAMQEIGMVVEGINALPAAMELMEKHQVEMPIIRMVHGIVNEGVDPREAVIELMRRDKKNEINY